MLQTSSYHAEEGNSFETVKEEDFRDFPFDSANSTNNFPNPLKQYCEDDYYGFFPIQLMDESNCHTLNREANISTTHEIVKKEQEPRPSNLNNFESEPINNDSECSVPGNSLNEIFKLLDNNSTANGPRKAGQWTGDNSNFNNENGLNGSEINVFIKKEDNFETYNEAYSHEIPRRPALGEIALESSPKLNQQQIPIPPEIPNFNLRSVQNKLQVETISNSNTDLINELVADGITENGRDLEYGQDGGNEVEKDNDEDYEEEEYEDEGDDDDEYVDDAYTGTDYRRGSKRLLKNTGKRTVSESYINVVNNFDDVGKSSELISKRKKTFLDTPLSISSCLSSSPPSENLSSQTKSISKSRKDGKIGIIIGKRTYRVTEPQLTLLKIMLRVEFEEVPVVLPKSKRFIKEKLNIPPEHLVRTARSDMMVQLYGIPFESIKSREKYFLIPPVESYTVNGESYLGAEPTETLYDPLFIRRLPSDDDNHGWCEVCGKWLQLRNHTYAHHFKSVHGVSQRTKTTVNLPKVIRGQAGNDKKMQGYCEPCQCWIDLHHRRNGQRWQTWYIHQFQIHHKDQRANETQRPVPGINSPVAHLFSGYLG